MASGSEINGCVASPWRGMAPLGACLAILLVGLSSPADSANSPWLEVPFVHQVKAGCGSAAVAMVMQYWASRQPGLDAAAADAARIDQVLAPGSKKGIQGRALKRYLEEHGFAAFVFSGEVGDLQRGKLIDIDLQRFLLAWKPAGNWALLAVPRTDSQPVRHSAQ